MISPQLTMGWITFLEESVLNLSDFLIHFLTVDLGESRGFLNEMFDDKMEQPLFFPVLSDKEIFTFCWLNWVFHWQYLIAINYE